jgi:signal transduction histidine kinase
VLIGQEVLAYFLTLYIWCEFHHVNLRRPPSNLQSPSRIFTGISESADDLAKDGSNIKIMVDDSHFDARPPILAIKPLISQVFSNILENAVKYSNSGSIIVVRGKHDPGRGIFTVQILNQGIPLQVKDEQRIFERATRTEQARRKYPAGTGFGLYIAKRIVAIHDGIIRATTEVIDGILCQFNCRRIKRKGKIPCPAKPYS